MSSSGTVRELWWEFATRKLLAREAEGYGKLDGDEFGFAAQLHRDCGLEEKFDLEPRG